MDFLPIDNSFDVSVNGFRSTETGEIIDDATFTAAILDLANDNASLVSQPLTHQTNGDYFGSIDNSEIALVNGNRYTLLISASNYSASWRITLVARYRPLL